MRGHGDQVYLQLNDNMQIEVTGYNDGFPNRMGGGGYSRIMPPELIANYSNTAFINWLQDNFWYGYKINICEPVDEETVKSFLKECME